MDIIDNRLIKNPPFNESHKSIILELVNQLVLNLEEIPFKNIVIVSDINGGVAESRAIPNTSSINIYILFKVAEMIAHEEDVGLGRHIINHEIMHCIDFRNACKYIDCKLLPRYGNDISLSTSHMLLTGLGCRLWSEYYAYRTGYSTHIEEINFSVLYQRIKLADIHLELFVRQHSQTDECSLYEYTKEYIHKFFYHLCKTVGCKHAKNERIYNNDLNQIRGYERIKEFIIFIDGLLYSQYKQYPKCISLENYIYLGECFFKIYNSYGIVLINKKCKNADFGFEIVS